MHHFKSAIVAAMFIGALGATAANASDIDSTGGVFLGNIAPFGSTNTATYGQTFVAGGNSMTGFSMFLTGGTGGLDFKGYVGAWDGAKLTSVLYASDTVTALSGGPNQYAFNTGSLAVTAGTTYVAFLSISDLALQDSNTYQMPGVFDTIAGEFVYLNSGTDFGQLSVNSWDNFGGAYDAFFTADFNDTAAAPEPMTWALMIGGFGLAGASLRRRKAVAA